MEQVSINKANAVDLMRIIHIGKKRAEKIIKRRPFKDLHELSNVLGLGKKRMDDIFGQGVATT